MGEAVKETKAQRAERLKRALNPWEAYQEIVRFAREGHSSIPPEWGTYFRWWGIYSQGDGVGAVGGKNGEGKAVPYFMVRVRIPNGLLWSHQLRALATLAERHARGIADLTVRQNVQLHWIGIQDLPDVLETLWRTGLTSLGACGDVTRNVTGCPLAGVDADELVDASPLVQAATRMLNGNPDFYNLPRKYKISITGCRAWCSYPEINDLGLTATRHPETDEVGFSLRVGGGLSTDPRFGSGSMPSSAGTRSCSWYVPCPSCSGTATSCGSTGKRRGSSSSSSPTGGTPPASRRSSRRAWG
jgi:sulfite reductase (ferredoxin)